MATPATFTDYGTIAGSANFQARVNYAMVTAAVNVYAEALNTPGHVQRSAFSKQVFNGGYSITAACLMVLTNSAIVAVADAAVTPGFAITDAQIQTAVNGLWNDFAGV